MSMWCPKCNRLSYNKSKCDFCGTPIEDTSKSYEIPKAKKPRILTSKPVPKQEISSYIDLLDEVFKKDNSTIKKNFKENIKKTYQDKKYRGDEYEEYIAKHYRQLGCHVIEHGKEKGVKDGGIDLIAELGNEVILIQCKDWNENYSHTINHKDIKVLRTDASDFLEKNPIYKNYQIKLRYVLSGDFLHKSAEKYMEECKEDISCEIIKPTYREAEQSRTNYIKRPSSKKRISQSKEFKKLILGIVALIVLFVFSQLTGKAETIKKQSSNENIIMLTDVHKSAKEEQRIRVENANRIQVERERKAIIYRENQKLKLEEYREGQRSKIAEKKTLDNRETQQVSKVQNDKDVRAEAKNKLWEQMNL